MNRKELRQKLLVDAILGQEDKLVLTAEFDGSGDSGYVHAMTGNEDVDKFLSDAVEEYTNFDWYNNDGGGGDITWHVKEDKIIINGYYNITTRENAMNEAEF
jgi:hypothetical protein